MAKVEIPEKLRKTSTSKHHWPEERFHGEIDILLGIEELELHPRRLDIVGNLVIFKSPLSGTTVL